jgi:large subunit ribosomal protein L28
LNKDTVCGKICDCAWTNPAEQQTVIISERILKMAKCASCGKTTTFGHNRSFSQHATNRTFRPNLQRVLVLENGHRVHKVLCAKCIRTLAKTA